MNEGFRQLNDNIHYEEINESGVAEVALRALQTIKKMHNEQKIDDTTFRFLKRDITKETIGKFFLPPKIHKIPENTLKEMSRNEILRRETLLPGRPIVSLCGTPLHNIGHYIDYFLLPLVQRQETYLKDTTHFINLIENLKPPGSSYLISFDARNMYNCFEFNEILSAVERALTNLNPTDYTIPIPDIKDLIDLLKIILENNTFMFTDKMYKQKVGVPMGGSSSAELADLRMYEILKNILYQFEHRNKILTCLGYRDDGFIFYKGSEEEIHSLFNLANTVHPHLKFTYEFLKN